LTLEDGNKLNKLSFKMTTTESNMDKDMKETALAHGNETFEDAEEGKLDGGLRHRGLLKTKLSVTSRKYDVDGDGKLDEAEQNMRDMDTDNRGYLTNEEVYKVMVEQMKLQREVFSLKRLSMVFLVVMVFLSLATLATSFAAATLAKDTDVKDGILVKKDSNVAIATSNAAKTFIVTEGATLINGRRTQNSGSLLIDRGDAVVVWATCLTMHIRLQRSCGSKTVEIPVCPNNGQWSDVVGGSDVYSFAQFNGDVIFNCAIGGSDCIVTFPATTTVCTNADDTDLIDLGSITPVVHLGTASNYAILTKSGIEIEPGSSLITGDIAVSPIAKHAMVGFNFTFDDFGRYSEQITGEGKAFAADDGGNIPVILTTAVSNMEVAYTDAAGRTTTDGTRINLGNGLLGGAFPGGPDTPLTTGVYTFSVDVTLSGNIHIKGTENDIFIIQIAKNLAQDAGYNVTLDTTDGLGTPKAENIFWQVSGFVDLGENSHMEGILLVKTSVTFVTGASLNGRILAQTACVLDSNTIVAPDAGVGA
jgi:hypothetical protein